MKNLIVIINIFAAFSMFAQTQIQGTVATEDGETLIGAAIHWEGSKTGVVSDGNGNFTIEAMKEKANLIVNYVGYKPMIVPIEPGENDILIQITGITELATVEIQGKQRDNFVSTLNPRALETISSNELKKAPCCNLSESFETNGSIDVSYSDAVTGAKEIQMLGLRGLYTQTMIENRPALSGLAYAYALEYIPGTWLQSIQIAKGAGSVINGYQSITGQVNAEIVKPYNDKKFFVNIYGETTGRGEINLHLNKKMNEHWSHGVLMHYDYFQNPIDNDGDGFMNAPLKKQMNAMYRLFHEGEIWCGQFNLHAIKEERSGGQLEKEGIPANTMFQTKLNTERIEAFAKFGYKGFAQEYNALGSQFSALYHRSHGFFGRKPYEGIQKSIYANLLYNTIISTTDHKIVLGTSFQYDDYSEVSGETNLKRTEIIPGVFTEYNFNRPAISGGYNDISIIAGLRADYNNLFGLWIVPRLNAKYNFNENTVIRFAAGRGIRTANVIAENIGILTTQKQLILEEALMPEDAWNAGINFTHNFKLWSQESNISIDAYRTQFVNQVIVDMDQDIQKVLVYNLDGKSFSNSLLLTYQQTILKGLDIKLAYKINDVKITYHHGLERQPLIPKHRGLVALTYETPNKKWMANASTQLIGKQRLPNHTGIPPQYSANLLQESPSYATLNAQITWKPNKFELYAGAENLTNFQQKNPIIAFDNPWSPFFDASQIYAPTLGRRIYAGMRYGF